MFRSSPLRHLRHLPPLRQQSRSFRVLGIETSCDDTCVSLLDIPSASSPPRILHNIVRRSLDISEPCGGIVPNLVNQFHAQTLARVLAEVRDQGGFEGLGLIAVTRGPGLPMCLAGGLNTGTP
jgi:N6-L-threonylcarbamoyladenine synthase